MNEREKEIIMAIPLERLLPEMQIEVVDLKQPT